MKKSFLKPFAATLGTMLAASAANATTLPVDATVAATISNASENLAGADVVLEHAAAGAEFAAHGSHSSHASHASHASHSSHASSAY